MIEVLRSGLLEAEGLVHGFSLRSGGVGRAPFDTLNLGGTVGDAPAAVAENRRRFARAVGLDEGEGRLFEVSQVHGARVVVLEASSRAPDEAVGAVRREEADALVARPLAGFGRAPAVGVRTADCVPVLAAHPSSGAVAAIHVGWRGAVAGVLPAALAALLDAAGPGATPAELVVAIGPHIRADAFEVGLEVAAALAEAAGPDARVVREPVTPETGPPPGSPRVDLAAVCGAQLARAGVPRSRVDDVGGCTFAEPDRFFSHRRDRGRTGRHLAVIQVPGA